MTVRIGAGSGELDAIIEPAPSDVDHYRVSIVNGSSSRRASILAAAENESGQVVITFTGYEDEVPVTFAVSYAHMDGRDSAIEYLACDQGLVAFSTCPP